MQMHKVIFGYTAIWICTREAELRWHIHYELSNVIPLLQILNVTLIWIMVL